QSFLPISNIVVEVKISLTVVNSRKDNLLSIGAVLHRQNLIQLKNLPSGCFLVFDIVRVQHQLAPPFRNVRKCTSRWMPRNNRETIIYNSLKLVFSFENFLALIFRNIVKEYAVLTQNIAYVNSVPTIRTDFKLS